MEKLIALPRAGFPGIFLHSPAGPDSDPFFLLRQGGDQAMPGW